MFTCRKICRTILTIANAVILTLISHMSSAAQIVIQTGDPQLSGVVNSTWRNEAGDAIHDYQFPAQGNMTSADMAAITMHGLLQVPGTDPASITLAGDHLSVTSTPLVDPLDDVLPGGSISWSTGSTAQERMLLSSPDVGHATIAATGFFQPNSQMLLPAMFTAGIVTDVGELSTTVSAQELNFQTDGPIICQALFQRLAPRAPQYGAQINFAGDRLEVYFDPAYTVTQGGIIFGTTSPSPGLSGTITTPPLPSIHVPSDYNNDDHVDGLDYEVWRNEFGNATSVADGNGDGLTDAADYVVWRKQAGIKPIATLGRLSASAIAVPEPSVLTLAALGLCVSLAGRKSRPAAISQSQSRPS